MLDEDDNAVFEYPGDDEELSPDIADDSINWESYDYGLTRENYKELFENIHPTASQEDLICLWD